MARLWMCASVMVSVGAVGCSASPCSDAAGASTTEALSHRRAPRIARPKISTNGEHTCALRSEGAVLCWGANDHGELGDGTTSDRATAAPVLGLAPAADVAAGFDHTCAVTADGAVWCWGSGANGALGDGSTGGSTVPVATIGLPAPAVAVAAAIQASCAALVDGSVWCWGDGVGGQGGAISPTLGNGIYEVSLVPVQALGIGDAVAITGSWNHFCALLRSGGVRCWGLDGGRLGDGTAAVDSNVPVAVVGLSDAVAISAGETHTCAVRRTGDVACWGDNSRGQLGDGTRNAAAVPVAGVLLSPALAVAAGTRTTCVVTGEDIVRCLGFDGLLGGALGGGAQSFPTNDSLTPVTPTVLVPLPPPFPHPLSTPLFGTDALTTGGTYGTSCATGVFGEAFCWGGDDAGQVGTGSTSVNGVTSPARVVGY